MLEMTERKKPGPAPLPPEEKGKRVNLYLSRDAMLALVALDPGGAKDWKSALVSRLLVAEAERRRVLKAQNR